MATREKIEKAEKLYKETSDKVIEAPNEWMSFLKSACRNYKLPFHEQIFVYAQRPDARAVITLDDWNKKFGRYVNKGSKGIAIAYSKGDSTKLKYYFDVSDTHETEKSKPLKLWEMSREYEAAVVKALNSRFKTNENDLASAILSSAGQARTDSVIKNSAAFMVMERCGIDASKYFSEKDFESVKKFKSSSAFNQLGNLTNKIAQAVLSEIVKTIQDIERSKKYGNHIQTSGRLSDSEFGGRERSDTGGRSGAEGGQIRQAAQEISGGRSGLEVFVTSDNRRVAEIPAQYAAQSGSSVRLDSREAVGTAGSERGAENQRPNAVGSDDEQHSQLSGGDSSKRNSLSSVSFPTIEEQQEIIKAEADENASAFSISQEDIDFILAEGSNFEDGKFRIYEQFMKHEGSKANAAFLKKEYGIGGGTRIFPDGTRGSQWNDSKGLSIAKHGSYSESDFEPDLLLSWSKAAKRIDELISADCYLSAKEKEHYSEYLKNEHDENLSFSEGKTEKSDIMSESEKEYRYSAGDKIYIGSQEYEIISYSDDTVRLYDTSFPIINKEIAKAKFDSLIKENPMNKHLLKPKLTETQEEQSAEEAPKAEISSDNSENRLFNAVLEYLDGKQRIEREKIELESIIADRLAVEEEIRNTIPLDDNDIQAEPQEQAEQAPAANQALTPQANVQAENYRISDDNIGVGTAGERFRNNINAIQTLKQIEAENRPATHEEQEILAKYVGWGGLANAFNPTDSRYAELRACLNDEEFAAARESTTTAFYTPPAVIRSIYNALENMDCDLLPHLKRRGLPLAPTKSEQSVLVR